MAHQRGDVVWATCHLPGGSKCRPCVVIGSWTFGSGLDYLVCVSSLSAGNDADPYCFPFNQSELKSGSLPDKKERVLRPTYLIPVGDADIADVAGTVTDEVLKRIMDAIDSVLA